MTREEIIQEIKYMIEDVNFNEVRSHVSDMALHNWIGAWRNKMNELVIQLKQTECEDAISREDAMSMILCYGNEIKAEVMDDIKASMIKLPPIQPKTGHWVEIAQYSDGKHKIECSECRGHIFSRGHANSFKVKNEYKFCPHCGKRMIVQMEKKE